MDRQARAATALYLCGARRAHRALRRARGARHPDGHLPEHQPSRGERRVDLHGDAPERHVRAHRLLLRAHALDRSQRHPAHRVAVGQRLRHRQDLLPAGREHRQCGRAGDRGFADGAQVPAPGHHPALCPRVRRLERADPAACAFRQALEPGTALRLRAELHSATAWKPSPGAALPSPYGGVDRAVEVDLNPQTDAGSWRFCRGRRHRDHAAEPESDRGRHEDR